MSRAQGVPVGPGAPGDRIAVVDAALAASKALVGVAARSLAVLDDDLTLVQFRALLLVVEGRAAGPGDLATMVDVHPSNAGRLVDRLVAKGFVERSVDDADRRHHALVPTDRGRDVVQRVLTHRRAVLAELLSTLSIDQARAVARGFALFAEAAGEDTSMPADEAWRLGWVS